MTVEIGINLRILVTGGARSGKSRYAETCLESIATDRIYIATAEASDDEMRRRILTHRNRRGAGWTTVEAPLDLPEAIQASAASGQAVLVDCLTLWLTNIMLADRDIDADVDALLESVRAARPIVLVSNEVGLGIVPENALARQFRDEQGRLNQQIADVCDAAVLMACGLPLVLKSNPTA